MTVGSPADNAPIAPGGWFAALSLAVLALSGYAAALSLVDAPNYGVYQHYWPFHTIMGAHRLAAGVLIAQGVVCAWLGHVARAQILQGARRIAPAWLWLLVAAVLAFSAAIPTVNLARFGGELVVACGIMIVAALNLVLIALALPISASRRFGGIIASLDGPRWNRWVPYLCATWVFVVSSGIAAFVFDRVPHIDDSICYLFQAKYLAKGVLWLPRPADPDSFGVTHLIVDGDKWYGKFFPGWPAALALGVLAGAPWLVNPLLAAGSIFLAHVLVRRLYDVRTAHLVTVLLALSPWLLYLSGSFMAHAASLFWMLLALVAIDIQRGRPAGIWTVIAGGSLGLLFLTRPFDAMLAGPVAGLWALGFGGRRLSVPALGMTALSAALVAGVCFWYSGILTGHASVAPHQLWADHLFGPGVETLGFGPKVGIPLWRNMDPLPGHGAADVVLNANKNFAGINFDLFGWACGSLALACLAFQRGGVGRRDWLMLGLLLVVIGGHSFYWAPGGPDFGGRYWYLTIVPLAVLTVRGLEILVSRLSVSASADIVTGRIAAGLLVASLGALAVQMPWRAIAKYDHYRGIGREVADLADSHGIADALVFIQSTRRADYQAAFNFNPPLLEGPGNVYAQDLGDARAAAVMAMFPTRPVWVIGRENDDAALSVLGGPFPATTKPHSPDRASLEVLQAIIR